MRRSRTGFRGPTGRVLAYSARLLPHELLVVTSSSPQEPQWLRLLARWAGFALMVGVAIFLLRRSWFAWPDVLVDFGRELYVPWMLAEGRTLYRDVAYFNGPLSPTWNALVFQIAGVRLTALVASNFLLLMVLSVLIYRVLRRVTSPFACQVALLIFVGVFAFGHYVPPGNYNYLTPYSHEATHGMVLSFGLLACLFAARRSEGRGTSTSRAWLLAAGLLLGLVFLTKPEVFLAAAGAAGTALLLPGDRAALAPRALAARGLVVCAASLAPVLLAFVLLARKLGWGDALVGTLGGWVYVARGDIRALPFYQRGSGFDDVLGNLTETVAMSVWVAVVVALFGGLSFLGRARRRQGAAVALVAILVGAILWALGVPPLWYQAARALPVLVAGVAVVALVQRWRSSRDGSERVAGALILAVFSLLLLSKMLLNARIIHYGFALAMPAAMLVTVAMVDWIPGFIERAGGNRRVFVALALSILLVGTWLHVGIADSLYQHKTVPVGTGGDRLVADQRGEAVNAALDWLATNAAPEETLAVLPEGAMINYLARRPGSTPLVNLMPPELLMFGEETILQQLRDRPPDLVALVHKNTTEYGVPFFGQHYAVQIGRWLEDHYTPVHLIGAPPFQGRRFGILMLRRTSHRTSVEEG